MRKAVGIPSDRPGNFLDILLYENFLQVRIVVLSCRIGNKRVYEGSPKYEKMIIVYHSEEDNKGNLIP